MCILFVYTLLKVVSHYDFNVGIIPWQGVVQNCHHFYKSTQSTLGEGVNGCRTLFKMLIMMHCISYEFVKNQHFQSTLLGVSDGVTKKVLCVRFR